MYEEKNSKNNQHHHTDNASLLTEPILDKWDSIFKNFMSEEEERKKIGDKNKSNNSNTNTISEPLKKKKYFNSRTISRSVFEKLNLDYDELDLTDYSRDDDRVYALPDILNIVKRRVPDIIPVGNVYLMHRLFTKVDVLNIIVNLTNLTTLDSKFAKTEMIPKIKMIIKVRALSKQKNQLITRYAVLLDVNFFNVRTLTEDVISYVSRVKNKQKMLRYLSMLYFLKIGFSKKNLIVNSDDEEDIYGCCIINKFNKKTFIFNRFGSFIKSSQSIYKDFKKFTLDDLKNSLKEDCLL